MSGRAQQHTLYGNQQLLSHDLYVLNWKRPERILLEKIVDAETEHLEYHADMVPEVKCALQMDDETGWD